ncbi:MAG: N-acetylmannosamine-6-phosphate 2-epimerase [Traorella sp.]
MEKMKKNRIDEIENGLIVSCYADFSINPYMDNSEAMKCVAQSCVSGGAKAIRTNLEHVKAIRSVIDVPLIGIKKIYKGHDELNSSFRITPTMKEVDALVEAGVDGIAIDGTQRERYDDLTLEEFVHQIKEKYPHIFVVADISTLEEGIRADKAGVDAVGTTLSGYTPYSKNPILFGTVPTPDPDYEIISELKKNGIKRVIAEGRISDGSKMKKCLEAGAYSVVIGTSITEPKKIVKTILYDANVR